MHSVFFFKQEWSFTTVRLTTAMRCPSPTPKEFVWRTLPISLHRPSCRPLLMTATTTAMLVGCRTRLWGQNKRVVRVFFGTRFGNVPLYLAFKAYLICICNYVPLYLVYLEFFLRHFNVYFIFSITNVTLDHKTSHKGQFNKINKLYNLIIN